MDSSSSTIRMVRLPAAGIGLDARRGAGAGSASRRQPPAEPRPSARLGESLNCLRAVSRVARLGESLNCLRAVSRLARLGESLSSAAGSRLPTWGRVSVASAAVARVATAGAARVATAAAGTARILKVAAPGTARILKVATTAGAARVFEVVVVEVVAATVA